MGEIGRDWDLAGMWDIVVDNLVWSHEGTRNMPLVQLGSRENVTLTKGQGQHVRISQALPRIVKIISIPINYLIILVHPELRLHGNLFSIREV